MRIALIGYGKMGKAIEAIALAQGHSTGLAINSSNQQDLTVANLAACDVAIEFTNPHSAVHNIQLCLQAGIPVVCGSTGWLAQWEEVAAFCKQQNGTLLYASNFSLGVNLFFELNTVLARLMQQQPGYDVTINEIHHTQKQDAPSGTAITLAEQVLQYITRKSKWVNHEAASSADQLVITSQRIDPAPGTHTVQYHSAIDDIEITHTAHSRQGFAAGAVQAATFVAGKKGIYTMKDVLGL
jgi:4-hydroxy-tetrahydrodipicolinate reductase